MTTTAIPYPDAKLDHVAIPDFAQGAMENLGCVTYRETLLLLDPAQATQEEQLGVAETVAHELAHMWFGDLVTMRWWNGIWLNEAFATFMSHLARRRLSGPTGSLEHVHADRANAFEVDALETTRPIEYPVQSPDDASGMFDTLTYTKGGAVLRMLEQWLGPGAVPRRDPPLPRASTPTGTPRRTTCGTRWRRRPASRSAASWTPGSSSRATRRSPCALDGDGVRFAQRRFIPSHPDDATTWPVPLIVRQVGTEAGAASTACWSRPTALTLDLLAARRARRRERRRRRASSGSSTTTSSGARLVARAIDV